MSDKSDSDKNIAVDSTYVPYNHSSSSSENVCRELVGVVT